MKKMRFLTVLLAIAGVAMLNSCGGDDPAAPPTITINQTSWELDFSQDTAKQVLFTADVSAEGEIETFTITEKKITTDGGAQSAAYDAQTTSSFKGETSKKYTFDKTFYVTDFVDYERYEYEFSVTDKEGQSYSIVVTVTKKEEQASDATKFTAIMMGAQSNNSLGSFLDAETGTVYMLSDASNNQDLIDFVYYYGSTNNATIAAPNDETVNGTGNNSLTLTQNWTTQNATSFYELSNVNFDDIQTTVDVENALTNVGSPLTKVTQLSVGTVVGFTTANGTNGVFKVTQIEGTSDGSITISVVIDISAEE